MEKMSLTPSHYASLNAKAETESSRRSRGVYAATEYVVILFIYLVLVIFFKFLEHHLYILV